MLPVVMLASALLAFAAPARPAHALQPAIGIGEQKATMFKSRYFKRLHVRYVRYVTPWDTLRDPAQAALLDSYLRAAGRAGVRVLLGFNHSLRSARLAKKLPSTRAFSREFRAIRKKYPFIHDYIVWNEANHPYSLTWKRPRRAAQFYDIVARNCRGCNIVAADVLDVRGMLDWVSKFRHYVHHRVRIWGIHNYGDANGRKTKGTQALLSAVRGQIWFTETGGLVKRRELLPNGHFRTYRYSLHHAAQATRNIFKLTCMSSRIRRVYLYHWRAPRPFTTWDSGFLDARGKPRPAYKVLLGVTKRAKASRSRAARVPGCRR